MSRHAGELWVSHASNATTGTWGSRHAGELCGEPWVSHASNTTTDTWVEDTQMSHESHTPAMQRLIPE